MQIVPQFAAWGRHIDHSTSADENDSARSSNAMKKARFQSVVRISIAASLCMALPLCVPGQDAPASRPATQATVPWPDSQPQKLAGRKRNIMLFLADSAGQ